MRLQQEASSRFFFIKPRISLGFENLPEVPNHRSLPFLILPILYHQAPTKRLGLLFPDTIRTFACFRIISGGAWLSFSDCLYPACDTLRPYSKRTSLIFLFLITIRDFLCIWIIPGGAWPSLSSCLYSAYITPRHCSRRTSFFSWTLGRRQHSLIRLAFALPKSVEDRYSDEEVLTLQPTRFHTHSTLIRSLSDGWFIVDSHIFIFFGYNPEAWYHEE